MVTILLPHAVPKNCFLSEALLYRVVGRLPLESISEDEADAPDCADLVLTPDECRVGGLQSDPKWEESEKEEGENLLNAIVAAPADSNERERLHEQWTKWKAVQDWRRNEWNHGFQKLLERHHDEFLKALLKGQLRSQGQRAGLLTKVEIADGVSWRDIPWESIPPTFWSSCEIDWEKCQAKDGNAAYDSIVVDTDDLFREFPLPDASDVSGIGKIGGYFTISDEIATPGRKLGRPSLPWDDFHLELAKHAANGTLDGKQEAFIQDMAVWCESRWGRKVGRSTLLQKIKPYFDEFVRSKKVGK